MILISLGNGTPTCRRMWGPGLKGSVSEEKTVVRGGPLDPEEQNLGMEEGAVEEP